MQEKLDIIITRHNESESVIANLLDSIKSQRGIDFNLINVIIVDDKSNYKLSSEFINKYNFSIKLLNLPRNLGPSGARNVGIERSNAQYIMFCDSDDCFATNTAIYNIFQKLNSNSDIYVFGFLAEQIIQGHTIFSPMLNDGTFIHAKVYKRQYLIDNDIKFDQEFKVHEDGYFNVLAKAQTKKIEFFQDIIYTWCFNQNSITRKDKDFIASTFYKYIDGNKKLVKILESKPNVDNKILPSLVGHVIYYSYIERQIPYWNNTSEENKNNFYLSLKEYYLENKDYFNKLTPLDKQYLFTQEMTKGLQRGLTSSIKNFEEFIKELEE